MHGRLIEQFGSINVYTAKRGSWQQVRMCRTKLRLISKANRRESEVMRRKISCVITPVPDPSSTRLRAFGKFTWSTMAVVRKGDLGTTDAVSGACVRIPSGKIDTPSGSAKH
jgi:hypothetical protein